MPSFELSKLQGVSAPRALSTSERGEIDQRAGARVVQAGDPAAKSGVALEIGSLANTTEPPVDFDRVAKIREALRDGSYPLVPTKIADAIIAARISFMIELG